MRLIETLKRVPAAVILSGYPSELYDATWRSIELQGMTRGGPRTEKLWFNFELAAAHWATFAGRDRTERQRIKRKAERWRTHYAELPAGERLAVLAAILSEHATSTADADDCARDREAQPPASTSADRNGAAADVYVAGGADARDCGRRRAQPRTSTRPGVARGDLAQSGASTGDHA